MAQELRQRSVIGTIVDALGAPIKNGRVTFKLTEAEGYTDAHVIVNRVVSVQTDTNGDFAANLWCDEDAEIEIDYTVLFPVADNGPSDDGHTATFSLAYAEDPINICELINPAPPEES